MFQSTEFKKLGRIVKRNYRFLIVMSSIVVGNLVGLWYFDKGDLLYDSPISSEEFRFPFFQEHLNFSEENQSDSHRLTRSAVSCDDYSDQTLFEATSRAAIRQAYSQARKTRAESEKTAQTKADSPQNQGVSSDTAQAPKEVQIAAQTQDVFTKDRIVDSNELTNALETLAQSTPDLDKKVVSTLVPDFKPQDVSAGILPEKTSNALPSPNPNAMIRIASLQSEGRTDGSNSSTELLASTSDLSVKQRLEGLKQLENQDPILKFQVIQPPKDSSEKMDQFEKTSLAHIGNDFQNAEISNPIGNYAALPTNPFANLNPPSAIQAPEEQNSHDSTEEESSKKETSVCVSHVEPVSESAIPLELYRSREIAASNANSNDSEETQNTEDMKNAKNTESQDAEKISGTPSSSPIRIKKPVRNVEKLPKESGEKYELDISRENIRKAFEIFQRETGLKIVASLNVQGEVSCVAEHTDPEILLRKLLTDTQFEFLREGNFIYVTHSENIRAVSQPLSKTETRVFTPRHISIDTLERVLASNLTQFGTCRRIRNGSEESLEVTDWILSLNELEDVQRLIDVPEAKNRMNFFAFQHELNGAVNQPLDLLTIAEGRGLVLQRMAIPELASKTKKPVFSKKEPTPDIIAYSISHRADSFMIAVKDQLKVEPVWTPDIHSEPMELDKPMIFEFGIKVNETQIPYLLSVAFRENPDASQEETSPILAEVECRPKTELNPKSKPQKIHFTLPAPSSSGNSLVFQLNMGKFALENKETRKNPIYAFHGNRTVKEVIFILNPFKDVQKLPNTTLTSNAVKAIIKQQETLGRKFYGSLDQKERRYSEIHFSVAQKLRAGMNVQR